jgi:CRP-like cAMP-binding protein
MSFSTIALLPSFETTEFKGAESSFVRKALLPRCPDRLWKITCGIVRAITWDEDGTIITLGLWGTGEVVGHLLSQVNPYQLECLTPVKISEVSLGDRQLHGDLVSHAQQVEILLSIVNRRGVHRRLVTFLDWLTQRFGRKLPQGWLIEPCLTHQEIAEIIGTTRVTVTRILNEWEQEGKIQRSRRRFIWTHRFAPTPSQPVLETWKL